MTIGELIMLIGEIELKNFPFPVEITTSKFPMRHTVNVPLPSEVQSFVDLVHGHRGARR